MIKFHNEMTHMLLVTSFMGPHPSLKEEGSGAMPACTLSSSQEIIGNMNDCKQTHMQHKCKSYAICKYSYYA